MISDAANTIELTADVSQLSPQQVTEAFQQCVARAKLLVAEEDWEGAIVQYERVIALRLDAPAWVYVSLGSLLVNLDRVDEAIAYYKKAISLDCENARTYTSLGAALEKKGLVSEAIASYSQALAVEPAQPAWLHTRLADLLSQRAVTDYKRAAVGYLQSMAMRDKFFKFHSLNECIEKIYGFSGNRPERDMQELLEKLSDRRSLDFATCLVSLGFLKGSQSFVNPAGYYFINEKLKIVYCSIPKNACTLFKMMMIESSGLEEEFEVSGDSVHGFLNKRIKEVSADHLLRCLSSDEYFKFVVLRDPFSRLVSGYLDKFAKHVIPEKFVQDIILSVQTYIGVQIDIEKSITFSQFIDYLERTPDCSLNDHWRPQHSFTASVKFDLLGKFESLKEVISTLENRFSIQVRQTVSNHLTPYKHFENDLDFHMMYPHQLRALGGMPRAQQMFTRPLALKTHLRYMQDVKLYEAQFDCVSY